MTHPPICSIIIISYKNFHETTGPCLHSLLRCPEHMEIIVVDNNSGDKTRKLLIHAAEMDTRVHLIFLDENRGYAAGNNVGAEAATSSLLLLLNSDTQVLPQSIERLCALMAKNPQWDMLGPVTNSAGNDQHIFCDGKNPEQILQQGAHWCNHSAKISFHTDRLIFFCVLIRTNLYKSFQGLDEDFGLGYFEDTDFVYRAREAGKQLIITEEVFVYHQGRGSFSKISGAVRALMKKNRKLFRKKHGHGEDTAHWRIKNVQALNRYQTHLTKGYPLKNLQYAFANRQMLAETLMPNNPVKRFFYRKKLASVIYGFGHIQEKNDLKI
jgi:GT2 family glycosyltransferase